MKLLMISGERGIPSGRKGAFWQTLEFLSGQCERIDVLCPSVANPTMLQPFPNVTFHPSPWPLLLQPRWIAREGERLHRAHHFDAITVHEYPPFLHGLGARWLSRKTGVPYALEFHHGEPIRMSPRGKLERLWMRLFVAADARRATRVRCVNAAAAETLVRWGVPREKVAVVSSLYLDLDTFKPDSNAKKEFDVAFCSRLVDGKGFPELVDVMRDIPSCTLLVIGDGPRRASYERLVKDRGLSDRVVFRGWLSSPREVADALRSAKIFVMNSWSEGNPRTAVEALACGIPVVATQVGIMPQVLASGANGMLVGPSTGELVSAVSMLLGDEARRGAMAAAAQASVAQFSRASSFRGYADFLRSIGA